MTQEWTPCNLLYDKFSAMILYASCVHVDGMYVGFPKSDHTLCLLTGGNDYNSGPYTVTFASGVTTAPFNIPITDDVIFEGNESIKFEIINSSLPSNVSVSNPDQATVIILDDDSKMNFIKYLL